ncbi:MAG: hypothetical protein AMJ81_10570 [Phycisphaerae bacterium SM23_33]|nr:MAG: hypothetical protein AMJ81_10570 [Phycisphaerae bacterium SM23_33]
MGTSGAAIASLVLGIAAIPSCMCYGLPGIICGILALVFSGSARRAVAEGRAGGNSLTLAKAGTICGAIGMVLGILVLIIAVIFIIAGVWDELG